MAQKTIIATRMELLKLKRKSKLAKKGHKLLKEKRDALISEFFKLVDNLKQYRSDVEEQLQTAYRSLSIAQAVQGIEEIERAADSTQSLPAVKTKANAIMGVQVPKFEMDSIESTPFRRGYSMTNTSVELDTASQKFELVLQKLIKLAEIEHTAFKLAEEIKKTKRKVNALEQIVIPGIHKTITYITMRLEEMERENFGRLKIIKKRMED